MIPRLGPAYRRLLSQIPEELYVCLGIGEEPLPGDWNEDQPVGVVFDLDDDVLVLDYDRDLVWECTEYVGPVRGLRFLFYTAPGRRWAELLMSQDVDDGVGHLVYGTQVHFLAV